MAAIFFQSFGQRPTLGIWAIIVLVQYMMGSSSLLASSRQIFAFSRDGALPASSWLCRMNARTGTPVNAVIFSAICAIMLGLLAFAGPAAINAVFALTVVAGYIAYSMPMVARWLWAKENNFRPGPWNLGRWVGVRHCLQVKTLMPCSRSPSRSLPSCG
jgi:amino acid transporter